MSFDPEKGAQVGGEVASAEAVSAPVHREDTVQPKAEVVEEPVAPVPAAPAPVAPKPARPKKTLEEEERERAQMEHEAKREEGWFWWAYVAYDWIASDPIGRWWKERKVRAAERKARYEQEKLESQKRTAEANAAAARAREEADRLKQESETKPVPQKPESRPAAIKIEAVENEDEAPGVSPEEQRKIQEQAEKESEELAEGGIGEVKKPARRSLPSLSSLRARFGRKSPGGGVRLLTWKERGELFGITAFAAFSSAPLLYFKIINPAFLTFLAANIPTVVAICGALFVAAFLLSISRRRSEA